MVRLSAVDHNCVLLGIKCGTRKIGSGQRPTNATGSTEVAGCNTYPWLSVSQTVLPGLARTEKKSAVLPDHGIHRIYCF